MLGPRPRITTQSTGAPIGATSRPVKAMRNSAAQPTTTGNGLASRATTVGAESAATRPTSANSATIVPPKASPAPASASTRGSHANTA
ncbi:Uncharacterised protein [Mycobacteroides abscessus subsp. abscessus]|nr:Uncharacterised protein [Mycobacteroides abscessus subsp. abscessus]